MIKRTLIISLLLGLLIMGCGEDRDTLHEGYAYPKIRLSFAPGATKQADITRVVLFVSAPYMETQEAELKVDGRTATGSIAVPSGANRLFKAYAYSGSDIEFEGESYVEYLEPGTEYLLEMTLEPKKLKIIVVPTEIKVATGGIFEVEIRVENVEELFGCTFELEYDDNMLRPLEQEITPGEFLGEGEEILFLFKSDPGRLSIGATRKAGTGGVSGSGAIARVRFQALIRGQTEVRIARNDNLALRRENGTSVDEFEQIIVKGLEVTID